MGGYGLGLSRIAATEFSFFLAIPVMFAATLYDLLKSWSVLAPSDIPLFAVGFIVSFVSALVVVKAFLSYVSGHSFSVFAWYRIVFGRSLLLTRVVARLDELARLSVSTALLRPSQLDDGRHPSVGGGGRSPGNRGDRRRAASRDGAREGGRGIPPSGACG